jgi:hypothetical protein
MPAKRSDLYVFLGKQLKPEILSRVGERLSPVQSVPVEDFSREAARQQILELFPTVVNRCLDQLPDLVGRSQEPDVFQRMYRIVEWAVLERLRQLQDNLPLGSMQDGGLWTGVIYDTLLERFTLATKRSDLYVFLGKELKPEILSRVRERLSPVQSVPVEDFSREAAKKQILELFPTVVNRCLDQLPDLVSRSQEPDVFQRMYRIVEWAVSEKLRQLQGNLPLGSMQDGRLWTGEIYNVLFERFTLDS